MSDVFGNALLDYQQGNYSEDITTHSSLGDTDCMPLPYIFRDFKAMPTIEQKALHLAEGKILDVGCGAGSHSLWLQEQGKEVVALDVSKGAIATSKARGVNSTFCTDILNYNDDKFDTIMLLMNGIGLAGTLTDLPKYLSHLKSLLKPNGQLLLDSSDIIYMFDADEDGGYWVPGDGDYYGEMEFVMEYKGKKSKPFPWLYVDFNTLQRTALYCGLTAELIVEGEHYDYLAKLTAVQ
ncbi:class I SAM-dependent methyltransferase [Croceivirga sp. JEA036]|uniref:class I SAM-dependent methyltransferase n=1 Tax=Croceivirga sp. JEA036 TaxID=2721162 RepID=UPI00143B48AE|nr:class I SAM-dependent methyltransferase [Croceivirga sp. JEA036]NJB37311.1 class I SAM-dependent methyltransferase [Croceivirga sp. JEA036]